MSYLVDKKKWIINNDDSILYDNPIYPSFKLNRNKCYTQKDYLNPYQLEISKYILSRHQPSSSPYEQFFYYIYLQLVINTKNTHIYKNKYLIQNNQDNLKNNQDNLKNNQDNLKNNQDDLKNNQDDLKNNQDNDLKNNQDDLKNNQDNDLKNNQDNDLNIFILKESHRLYHEDKNLEYNIDNLKKTFKNSISIEKYFDSIRIYKNEYINQLKKRLSNYKHFIFNEWIYNHLHFQIYIEKNQIVYK